ncbi:MAG: RnfH family protein [Proteobacteria bacterium]|nr:RnfH family protein [Pseudomonadota bacterium]
MATPDGVPRQLAVSVVHSPCAGRVDEVALTLPAGSTVGDALQASGLAQRHPGLDVVSPRAIAVWGRPRALTSALLDGDRVEVLRPLRVDPKDARRLRQRGARRA